MKHIIYKEIKSISYKFLFCLIPKNSTPSPPVCISQPQLGKCPIKFLTPPPVGEISQVLLQMSLDGLPNVAFLHIVVILA